MPTSFATFYDQFGRTLKEGLVVDPANKERIAKLLRFRVLTQRRPQRRACRSMSTSRGCRRARSGSTTWGAPTSSSIAKSPNLEIFRRKGLEVLYPDRPDRRIRPQLAAIPTRGRTSPRSTRPTSIFPMTGPTTEPDQDAGESSAKESGFTRVLELFRTALGNRVSEVRESKRLTDSPCCLVNAEGGMSTQMQRLLKMANKDFTESARILEINPSAPLVRRLCRLSANEQHDDFIKTVRTAALDQRDDPRRPDARARGHGRAGSVVHGRGRREAIAAHPSWEGQPPCSQLK